MGYVAKAEHALGDDVWAGESLSGLEDGGGFGRRGEAHRPGSRVRVDEARRDGVPALADADVGPGLEPADVLVDVHPKRTVEVRADERGARLDREGGIATAGVGRALVDRPGVAKAGVDRSSAGVVSETRPAGVVGREKVLGREVRPRSARRDEQSGNNEGRAGKEKHRESRWNRSIHSKSTRHGRRLGRAYQGGHEYPDPMSVSREKLYEEVWAAPMTTVAKRYDVSSNFLARVCERLNVPRPARGYWQQLRVGKTIATPRLPPARPGDQQMWVRGGPLPELRPTPMAPHARRTSRTPAERPSRHPLVVGVRESFEASRVRAYHDDHYLKPLKRNIVDLMVSKDTLRRALDAASSLFLTLEDRGHTVVFAPADTNYTRAELQHREGATETRTGYSYGAWRGPARPTLVFIGEVAIGLTVFEVAEESEMLYDNATHDYVRLARDPKTGRPRAFRPGEWGTKKWMPSGRLGVHAYSPQCQVRWEQYWRESEAGDIPKTFDRVVKDLEQAAPVLVKLTDEAAVRAAEQQKKWEAERAEAERKEAARRKVEEEKRQREEVRHQIDRWRFARDARAMVAELQSLLAARGLRLVRGGDEENWTKLVLEEAKAADPLARLRDDADAMAKDVGTSPRPKSPLGSMLRLRRRRREVRGARFP